MLSATEVEPDAIDNRIRFESAAAGLAREHHGTL